MFAFRARCFRRVTSLAPPKTGIQSSQQLRCKSYPAPQVKPNLNAAISRPILARSWLFSAKSSNEIKKVVTLGADVIILDMEDSVPGDRKEEMRKEYRTALDEGIFSNACVYVRVNETSCLSELEKDVDALTQRDVAGFILPRLSHKTFRVWISLPKWMPFAFPQNCMPNGETPHSSVSWGPPAVSKRQKIPQRTAFLIMYIWLARD